MPTLTIENCRLCPRRCGVNRRSVRGLCGGGELPKVALASLHYGEEPCFGGKVGTVFFSGCSLNCLYCQNYAVSHDGWGYEISAERLAEIFLELQTDGAEMLDLVTPTHFVLPIAEALQEAKSKGMILPVIYNCGGYELTATVDFIAPLTDIFLPDIKYRYAATAYRYSGAANYFEIAAAAVTRMVKQKGKIKFTSEGKMTSGVLVRHLVLPGGRHESMAILDWLWENFGSDIGLSLMGQYIPMGQAEKFPPLNRRLTTFEYESVVEHAQKLGFNCGYIQQKTAATADFVPTFDGRGVKPWGAAPHPVGGDRAPKPRQGK